MDMNTLLLLGAGAFLVYFYFFKDKGATATTKTGVNLTELLQRVGKHDEAVVGSAPVVQVVDAVKIVKDWSVLRDDAETLGLTDAEEQLDELWKMLNPRIKRTV